MADETPRFGLHTFERGDTDWSHTDLVQFVDSHAIDSGSITDRPPVGEYDDELYFATDQGLLWRWDENDADWRGVAGRGTEERPLPGTVHRESVATDELSNVPFVSPTDATLQATLDRVASTHGGGLVILEPGTHDRHDYPVTVPNGVTLRGAGKGATTPQAEVTATVLDAEGGPALTLGSNSRIVTGITVESFRVDGTVRTRPADYVRNFSVRDIRIDGPDADAGTGRGLEILTSGDGSGAFLYDVRNVDVESADGYGVYVEHDGQATFDRVACYHCGTVTDGAQMYFSSANGGGGEASYRRLIAGETKGEPGVDGIVMDGIQFPQIRTPQIERNGGNGLVIRADAWRGENVTIDGGKIFDNAGIGLVVGQGGDHDVKGADVRDITFFHNGEGDVRWGSNVNQAYQGICYSKTAGVPYDVDVAVDPAAHHVRCDPTFMQLKHNDPSDLSQETGVFFGEKRLDDGSVAPRSGIECVWSGSEWVYPGSADVDVDDALF